MRDAFPDPDGFRLRRFALSDWGWVRTWFTDEALNEALGPVDEEWARHVTTDPDGVELVVETADGTPVALVGVAWDRTTHNHAVTDVAVDPERRRTGVGALALAATLKWPDHPPARQWVAFVTPENSSAMAFFHSLGWTYEGIDDGMHRFVHGS